MRPPRRALLLLLCAGALAAPAARIAGASGYRDPSCGTWAIAPRAGALRIALPHGFMRAGTDSLWSNLRPWTPRVDYTLDRVRGELRLLREAAPGETLRMRACWLLDPPPVESSRQRYRAITAGDSAAPAPAPVEPRPVTAHAGAPPSGAALALTGNKTLAVEFGSSQDAVLRQSLDLALSGSLAPGVELTGVLTDRNTPVTATGSTLDLQAVDQVRIELTAPRGGATLGDLSLRFDDGEFARLDRRLQGARGEWNAGGFQSVAAAASATGEYRRIEFLGVDGQQGPYLLTNRDGGLGISVVAGSEAVTLDGARLARGESADYSIDYERGRLTFTNRRLITSASRITVDYQYTLQRYRRNFTSAGTRWTSGAFRGFARLMSETDDRGSPLSAVLDATDRLVLANAGDSVGRAIGPGVSAGVGDYDTVRVAPARVVYAYAGPDSGRFAVQFARVGAGRGDYADSAVVAGRTAYRYVGAGAGAFTVGRSLPLPEAHSLWAGGLGARLGAGTIEFEGAASKLDLNTFSALDDRGNAGFAGRAALRVEGRPLALGGRASVELSGRAVDRAFAPFAKLVQPFEAEHWGVPATADFEHARRGGVAAEWRPAGGGTLRVDAGRLRTPDGVAAGRASAEWGREAAFATHALWERAASRQDALADPAGGRDHLRADARWALPRIAPLVRAEIDERRFPSDSGHVGDRFRSAGGELATGSASAWHALGGFDLRRDARRAASGFVDQSESRTSRLTLESPSGRRLAATLLAQRRDVRPLADPRRSRSDLASLRVRGERPSRNLVGEFDVEIGADGENRRTRALVFAGAGRGAYDALGNFTGVGDYNLTVSVSPELERLARTATRARGVWTFGSSQAWRGSRIEVTFESEARRGGDRLASDVFLAPRGALADAALVHGMVVQRVESEFAPQSKVSAVRLRAERRVTADHSFVNFGQTTDDQSLSARWRARASAAISSELELTARRQGADQTLSGFAGSSRSLESRGAAAQLIVSPDARLRLVFATSLELSRPAGQAAATRTVRAGPDVGLSVGHGGRAEVSVRRAFIGGPAAVALIPTADPAGAPRWEGTSRFDYRLLQNFTVGISALWREFPGRRATTTGRAEMRAFF